MICTLIFAQEAKAQTMASAAQLLSPSGTSIFYTEFFQMEGETSAISLSGEQALTTIQEEVYGDAEDELTDEGMFCVVRDKKGNKVASCFICNCAELTRAYWSTQSLE